jgi:hypothetical protein
MIVKINDFVPSNVDLLGYDYTQITKSDLKKFINQRFMPKKNIPEESINNFVDRVFRNSNKVNAIHSFMNHQIESVDIYDLHWWEDNYLVRYEETENGKKNKKTID